MRLMTNNPKKRVGLQSHGLEVVELVPMEIIAYKGTTEAVADAIGAPYTIEAQLDSFKAAWQQAQAAH